MKPSCDSSRMRLKSYFDDVRMGGTSRSVSPGARHSAVGAFWSVRVTWKKGVWRVSRAGWSSSTSFSKGRSWCSKAPSVVALTWASSVRNEAPGSMRARSTSVFTKKPMRPSVSARVRPATGAPTLTSSWPAYRDSRS
ncbi:hypothetical protein COSO111634_20830 [Corallococcus soli]